MKPGSISIVIDDKFIHVNGQLRDEPVTEIATLELRGEEYRIVKMNPLAVLWVGLLLQRLGVILAGK